MRLNIPTILTFLRIALIPVFVVAYYLPYAWAPFAAALIFIIAGATDWLDGYLARRLKQSISALREWMAEIGKRASVAVSWVGKFKTGSQMFALTMLLWHGAPWNEWLGYIALYVAAGLTYWSMYQYMMAAKDDLLADPDGD